MRPDRRQKGIRRAERVLKVWDRVHGDGLVEELHRSSPNFFYFPKKMIHTRRLCNCWACSWSKRRVMGAPYQERKAAEDARQQLRDLLSPDNP